MFKSLEANELTQCWPRGGAGGTKATGKKCETSAEVVSRGEQPLIASSFCLPSDFFAKKALVAQCILGNSSKIKNTAWLDIGATRYLFVNPAMVRRICDKLLIKPIRLSKPKAIQGFNGKQALDVTHAIYSIMTVQRRTELTTPMLITKLGQHQIILGKLWIKNHGVILDMKND